MGNQSQQPQRLTIKEVETLLGDMREGLAQVLPSGMNIERYERIFISEIKKNQALLECTKKSIGAAAMKGAVFGIEPGVLGRATLNSYNKKIKGSYGQPDKYVKEMEFVLGYKGILDLAYRSGEVLAITAEAVKEKDHFLFMKGMHENLEHIPAMKDRGETIAYYAYAKLKNGGFKFVVMNREEMLAHALQFSKQVYNGKLTGAWSTSFDGMAKKTMITDLLKYLPLSTELHALPQETADPIPELIDLEPEADAEPEADPIPDITPESDPREYLKQYQRELYADRQQSQGSRSRRQGII